MRLSRHWPRKAVVFVWWIISVARWWPDFRRTFGVGVVKVAVPGCKIELFEKDAYTNYAATVAPWMKNMIKAYDGNPYQFLVDQAKVAQKDGVIKGILLHQGESNPNDKEWPNKVKGIYENLIKDLNLKPEKVPLLAGETVNADQQGTCAGFNKIHGRAAKDAAQFPCHFLGRMHEQRPPPFQFGRLPGIRKALRREDAFLAGASSSHNQVTRMNCSVAFIQALVAAALCGNLACAQTNRGFGRPADQPAPRTDRNSQIAHEQLVEKAKKGGIDVYLPR